MIGTWLARKKWARERVGDDKYDSFAYIVSSGESGEKVWQRDLRTLL